MQGWVRRGIGTRDGVGLPQVPEYEPQHVKEASEHEDEVEEHGDVQDANDDEMPNEEDKAPSLDSYLGGPSNLSVLSHISFCIFIIFVLCFFFKKLN